MLNIRLRYISCFFCIFEKKHSSYFFILLLIELLDLNINHSNIYGLKDFSLFKFKQNMLFRRRFVCLL